MAMVDGDWSVDRATGNIRYIGGDHDNSPTYATVIQFHRWLQDKADNASTTGDDELDITDTNPSERSTDNIIKLINGYNVDDRAIEHLYDGSIIQGTGGTEEFYDGIVNFGNSGVDIQIIQNGQIIADDFWNLASGVGINEDTTQGISHRFLVKVRTAGADIDARKLLGFARTFTNTYAEFSINGTSRGNNVLALSDSSDLNNATAIGTVAGWTTAINDIEGYNNIQVEGDGVDYPFYSSWDKGTQSINDLYERVKWYTKDPVTEDNAADTGTDANYVVDNATITGQAQGFDVGVNAVMATKVRVKLKIGAGTPTGNITASIYSDTAGAPNASVAVSGNYDASLLTSTYEWVTFEFTGAQLVELTASTKYHVVIEHLTGDGSNYVHVEGDSAGAHTYDRYHNTAGWTQAAGTNLYFDVFTAPEMYGLPGFMMRGPTHQVQIVDTAITGTFNAFEKITWSGGTGQLLAASRVTSTGTTDYFWIQLLTGSAPGDSVTLTGDASSASVNTAAASATTDRSATVPSVLLGASTGSAIIGAYGFGVEYADLTQNDTKFALTDPATPLNPPNNVQFTVTGTDTDSYILIAPRSGTDTNGDPAIQKTQMTTTATLSGAAETSVTTATLPASGYPDSTDILTTHAGTVRIEDDAGDYIRVEFDSITGTGPYTINFNGTYNFSGTNATSGNNMFFSYLDQQATGASESYKQVHDGTNDQDTVIIVRDGAAGSPTKQYIAAATWSSSNQSTGAILTSDE